MRVLVVDDDDRVGAALIATLSRYGIDARRVASGGSAMELLDGPDAGADVGADADADAGVDVVLLDLGLPDVDGMVVCQALRERSDIPIIVVTGRDDVAARIQALQCGADDFLVKPFDTGELLARIHAVRRRCVRPNRNEQVLRRCDLVIDLATLAVSVAGEVVSLSTKELKVLILIAAERGEVCSRERIIAEIWGRSWPGADNTLNVHIAMLRSKLGHPGIIQTVRGIGYRLCADEFESTPVPAMSVADGVE